MKNHFAIGLALLPLLFPSSASAYERHWSVEKVPYTWDLELFEQEAGHSFEPEQSVSGILQTVQPIVWHSAEMINEQWATLKSISDPKKQLSAIRQSTILTSACDSLIDFRKLTEERKLPIRWRDQHRGRTWMDPTTATTLLYALESFNDNHPGYTLTLGDMAQAGCGQLEYGTLISHVEDTETEEAATELLNQARLHGGTPVVQTIIGSSRPRKMVEKTLLGHSFNDQGLMTLRVATRTYRRQGVGPNGRARHRVRMWDKQLDTINAIETKRVITTLESGRSKRLWYQHWVSQELEKQVIVLSSRRLNVQQPLSEQLAHIDEMRFSRWDIKKPLSFKAERRWVRRKGARSSRWESWALVHEAGHQTHTSGRDVDISYVTKSNYRHFNGSWKAIDSQRTWKWFEILVQAAQEVGGHVEKILVGPRIHRILKRRLPKKVRNTHLFRKVLKRVDGHDAHHHLRLGPSQDLGITMIPWIWRFDEPLWNILGQGLTELHR